MQHCSFVYSDTMDNLGAFITLNGKDMIPNYTTYTAVVSIRHREKSDIFFCFFFLQRHSTFPNCHFQPHPNVKPMAYASSLMSLLGQFQFNEGEDDFAGTQFRFSQFALHLGHFGTLLLVQRIVRYRRYRNHQQTYTHTFTKHPQIFIGFFF